MANTGMRDLSAKLSSAPTYQKALRGEWTAPGMPNTPGFRAEQLRAAAAMDGVDIPSGYYLKNGEWQDINESHWYSDPRVVGPLAVGASVPIFGALAAPEAAGTTLAADAAIGHPGIDAALSAWDAANAAPLGGLTTGGGAAAASGIGSKIKDYLTDPKNIAGLAATIPAIASGTGGGNSPLNDPTVQQLLQMSLKRQQRTDPLHEAVTSLSMAMLPTAYQKKGA